MGNHAGTPGGVQALVVGEGVEMVSGVLGDEFGDVQIAGGLVHFEVSNGYRQIICRFGQSWAGSSVEISRFITDAGAKAQEFFLRVRLDKGGEPPAAWHAFNHDGQSMAQHSVSGNSSPQGPTSVDLEA
jgi:hypothetical protein